MRLYIQICFALALVCTSALRADDLPPLERDDLPPLERIEPAGGPAVPFVRPAANTTPVTYALIAGNTNVPNGPAAAAGFTGTLAPVVAPTGGTTRIDCVGFT
jgi:hypothetical protein